MAPLDRIAFVETNLTWRKVEVRRASKIAPGEGPERRTTMFLSTGSLKPATFARRAMAELEAFLDDVMTRALDELAQRQFPVFTLAFYLDHESAAVSVCADTWPNSDRVVASINTYNLKHFLGAVLRGDLATAALWQANVGRSLSLGDFEAVNVARTELGDVPADAALCRGMIETIIKNHDRIRELSPDPARTALAASTLDDEVGLVWSLPAASS